MDSFEENRSYTFNFSKSNLSLMTAGLFIYRDYLYPHAKRGNDKILKELQWINATLNQVRGLESRAQDEGDFQELTLLGANFIKLKSTLPAVRANLLHEKAELVESGSPPAATEYIDVQLGSLEGMLDSESDFAKVPTKEIIPKKAQKEAVAELKKDGLSQVLIRQDQPYTAHRTLQKILEKAKKSVDIIDNYVDENTLDVLSEVDPKVPIRLITKTTQGKYRQNAPVFNKQHTAGLETRISKSFHDRIIFVDGRCWHSGPSIKQLGSKMSIIVELTDPALVNTAKASFAKEWSGAKPI